MVACEEVTMNTEANGQRAQARSGGHDGIPPVVRRYFEAWNQRDAAAIAACFASGGTYSDPMAGQLAAAAIAGYVEPLWRAFPDLSFEILSAEPAGAGRIAAQWLMRGTNTGPLQGLPPTGRPVALPGADFIRLDGEAIGAVEGYFDQRAIPAQLGLMTVIQPRQAGPFQFGTALAVPSGKQTRPGAVTITSIEVRSEEEAERVRTYSRNLVLELRGLPGFLGWTGVAVGNRMFTLTAWENAGDPHRIMASPIHRAAVAEFHRDLGASALISTWKPADEKPIWIRCRSCGRMSAGEQASRACACGQPLPEPPGHW
jgi:steroid delta-isomerase-like uncharacterized protein